MCDMDCLRKGVRLCEKDNGLEEVKVEGQQRLSELEDQGVTER